MIIGHLAPIGPIAAAAERRCRRQLEQARWLRLVLWGAALGGSIFPDLDIIVNLLFRGAPHHLFYLPHSLLLYLPLLPLGWALTRWRHRSWIGWAILTFASGVFTHLLLDVISHGTVLLYPLWKGLVGWAYPPVNRLTLGIFVDYPNLFFEPAVTLAGLAWWLWQIVRALRIEKARSLFRPGRPAPSYLPTLPRHEGSRPIQLDKSRSVR